MEWGRVKGDTQQATAIQSAVAEKTPNHQEQRIAKPGTEGDGRRDDETNRESNGSNQERRSAMNADPVAIAAEE